MSTEPRSFSLNVTEDALTDLQQRLARTRFPDQAPGTGWECGTELSWFQSLVNHWQHNFDWRAQEARLNAFPQFRTHVAGIDLHFLRVPGQGPEPMPLLLAHGWPGSVFEFLELIPRLTDPVRFGGASGDSFTVVAPSLPGYGLSFSPGQPRFSVEQMADCLAGLMSDVLGYKSFAAQGGDWGASIASSMGYHHADKLVGIHLNFLPLPRDPGQIANPDAEQKRYLDDLRRWLKDGAAYGAIQGTRPQTLAYGLTDSPAGLASWIVEKMRAWSDCGGDLERSFTKDEVLANISLYWFTGAIGSSFWPYYARAQGPWPVPDGIDVPVGYCEFPAEFLRPPRSLAAKTYSDIRRWTVMPAGGHFAAMEQPDALAKDIREFFRPLRTVAPQTRSSNTTPGDRP